MKKLKFLFGVLHTAALGYPLVRIESWRELRGLIRWALED